MNFMEVIENIREYEGVSQIILANELGITKSCYSNYKRYDRIMPLKHINNLANYFNVSIDYLFEFTDNKDYPNTKKLENISKSQVGNNLKQFRKENKITLVKLAEILNTSHSTLSAYENGKTLILTSFLYTICKKYGISADYLLGRTTSPKYLDK